MTFPYLTKKKKLLEKKIYLSFRRIRSGILLFSDSKPYFMNKFIFKLDYLLNGKENQMSGWILNKGTQEKCLIDPRDQTNDVRNFTCRPI